MLSSDLLVRGETLDDGFPVVVRSFPAPAAVPYVEVRDTSAPVGKAFYRLEEEDAPP